MLVTTIADRGALRSPVRIEAPRRAGCPTLSQGLEAERLGRRRSDLAAVSRLRSDPQSRHVRELVSVFAFPDLVAECATFCCARRFWLWPLTSSSRELASRVSSSLMML